MSFGSMKMMNDKDHLSSDESLDTETIKILKQMNKYRRKKENTDE